MVKVINNLLNKEMDRKEFLTHMGVGVLVASGVSGLIKGVGQGQPRNAGMGYGASAYGGSKRS